MVINFVRLHGWRWRVIHWRRKFWRGIWFQYFFWSTFCNFYRVNFWKNENTSNLWQQSRGVTFFIEYSRNHGLDTLYDEITNALNSHRPADPVRFLHQYLDNQLFVKAKSQPIAKPQIPNLEVGCFVKGESSPT